MRNTAEDKEAYEIEKISLAHARSISLSSEMQRAAYENGFSHEHVHMVLGLVLRDELLEADLGQTEAPD